MRTQTPMHPYYLPLTLILNLAICVGAGEVPAELLCVKKQTITISAFRPNPEFDRHDPSNVIHYDHHYWAYYTHNVRNHQKVSVHVASSADGHIWTDLGQALGRGVPGAWDESGTIAPYVVPHQDRFILFYTGFRNSDLNTRQLGCAIACSPLGPWQRWPGNPVLHQSPDSKAWDSGMLGDSNVLFREGKWWLYFKSRRQDQTARDTHTWVWLLPMISPALIANTRPIHCSQGTHSPHGSTARAWLLCAARFPPRSGGRKTVSILWMQGICPIRPQVSSAPTILGTEPMPRACAGAWNDTPNWNREACAALTAPCRYSRTEHSKGNTETAMGMVAGLVNQTAQTQPFHITRGPYSCTGAGPDNGVATVTWYNDTNPCQPSHTCVTL